jgi:hypothetical protein
MEKSSGAGLSLDPYSAGVEDAVVSVLFDLRSHVLERNRGTVVRVEDSVG